MMNFQLQIFLILIQNVLVGLVGIGGGFTLSNYLNDRQPAEECAVPITQPQGNGLEQGVGAGADALEHWKALQESK